MPIHRIRESFIPSLEFWAKQRLIDAEEFKKINPEIYNHYQEAQKQVEKGIKRLRESQKQEILNSYRESGFLDPVALDKIYAKDPNKVSVKFWRVPISRYGNMCGNNRIYTLPLWQRVRDKQIVLWKGVPGLCDHPKEDDDPGELKYACIVWLGIEIDEENKLIWGIGVFVGDLGRMLQEIIEVGGKVGFSTSGFGETIAEYLKETTGKVLPKNDERNFIIRPESFVIERLADVVINPSQQVYGNAGLYEDSMASKATKAEVIEYTNKQPETVIRESNQPKSRILKYQEDQMSRIKEGQALQSIIDAVDQAATEPQNQNVGGTQNPPIQPQPEQKPAQPQPEQQTVPQPEQQTVPQPEQQTVPQAQSVPQNSPAPTPQNLQTSQQSIPPQQNNGVQKMTESLTLNDNILHKYVESYLNKDIAQIASPVERLENLTALREKVENSTKNEKTLTLVREALTKAQEDLKHFSENGQKIAEVFGEDATVENLQFLQESQDLTLEDNEDLKKLNETLIARNRTLKKDKVLSEYRENKTLERKNAQIKALREELTTKNILITKLVTESNNTKKALRESQSSKEKAVTVGKNLSSQIDEVVFDVSKLSKLNEKLTSNNNYLVSKLKQYREEYEKTLAQNSRLQKLVEKYQKEAQTVRAEYDHYREEQAYKADPRNYLAPNKSDVVGSFLNFREANGDDVTEYWDKLVDTYGEAVMPLRESINKCKTKSEAARVFLNNKDTVDRNFSTIAHLEGVEKLPKALREAAKRRVGIEDQPLTREIANSQFGELMRKNHLGGL